jgi:diguanylate cyclase (GGDEF)-like protein/PAS domain S-box-containing protein
MEELISNDHLSINNQDCNSCYVTHQASLAWNPLVATISLRIRQSLELPQILQATVDEVYKYLNCDRVMLYQFDPDWSGRVVVESVADPQWSLLDRAIQDSCFNTSWLKPYQKGWFASISNIATANLTPCYREFLEQLQVKSNLVIPILHESQLWGLLIAHHCLSPQPWEPEQIRGLQQIAVHLGIAIHQASLVEQLQAAKTELETQVTARTFELEQVNQQLLAMVDECKQAEQDSKEQAAILSSFYNSSPLMMGVVELSDHDILHISDNLATANFMHINADDLVNAWASELGMTTDAIEIWLHHYYTSQEQQRPVQFEYAHTIETEIYWLLVTVSFIGIAESQRPRFSYVAEDISNRKQTELALKQSETTNRALIQSIPDFLVRMRLDGMQMEFINGGVVHCLSSQNGIDGNHITQIMPLEIAQERIRLAEIAIATGQIQRQEYKFIDKEETYYEEARIAPLSQEEVLVVVRDITVQKQNEIVLKNLSDRLTLALSSGAIGTWECDFVNLFWDRQMYEIYELQHLDRPVTYEDWVAQLHTDDRQPTETALAAAIAGTQDYNVEFRIDRQDGTQRWIKGLCLIQRNAQGEPSRMIGINYDITDLKQAELDARTTKNQLELVLQASSEGFWDYNLITGDIYFSPQWKAMLGYEDWELENSFEMWAGLIFPEDHQTALQLIEDYNNDTIDRFVCNQRFHHKNGSTVHILSRAIHLKDDRGQVVRMVGSHLDMTPLVEMQKALQTSEMQLSSVLNSSLDGIMAFQALRDDHGLIIDFIFLLVNPTASEIVNRLPGDLIGKRLLEELPGNKEEGLFDAYVQVVETGEPAKKEFYYNHDGIDLWFEHIAVKLGDGFAISFRDITDLKQSKLAIQKVNQELEERISDLNQRHQEMLLLSELSDFLQACLTVEEACAAISHLVEPLFPNYTGGIFITNASRNQVELLSAWGESLHSQTDFHPQDCWALRRGRTHFVDYHRAGLRCNHIHTDQDINSTLCIPLIAQGENLGLFYLDTKFATILPEAKQQLARTVAERIALAIANLRLQETLQHQSIRDPLTGLFNRRYLEEIFNQELSRAQRQQQQIGVIMLDIDHFKRFNDTYGHEAGDYVLQMVGILLKDSVRASDVVCRYGGEEIILVLPNSSLEATQSRAEEIRLAIAKLSISHNGQLLGIITASLGVASFPQHGATGNAIIQEADAALYRAKAAGRNQVILAL